MHPFINTAVIAARKAGDIIARAHQRLDLVKVSKKGDKDFVTNVDKASEQEIIHILSTAYPNHSILAEESGNTKGNDYQWIIDPLDGTTNFMRGFPHVAISIALSYRERIEHGVIYDPLRGDLFTASRGEGAQKNNYKIRVSQHRQLKECLLGTGFPPRDPQLHDIYFDTLKNLSKETIGIRRAGAAALDLAYVASGQLDGFWEFSLKKWDIAAGILLIKEAGGLVSEIDGGEKYLESGDIVAANPLILKQLLKKLKPLCKKLEYKTK